MAEFIVSVEVPVTFAMRVEAGSASAAFAKATDMVRDYADASEMTKDFYVDILSDEIKTELLDNDL